jgi:hypothetical protein
LRTWLITATRLIATTGLIAALTLRTLLIATTRLVTATGLVATARLIATFTLRTRLITTRT